MNPSIHACFILLILNAYTHANLRIQMIKGSCANEVYDRIYWANGKLKFHMLIHKNAKDTVIRISACSAN